MTDFGQLGSRTPIALRSIVLRSIGLVALLLCFGGSAFAAKVPRTVLFEKFGYAE